MVFFWKRLRHIFHNATLLFVAERRAQLARSRSRQNIFQAQSPDIVREITFDDSNLGGPGGDNTPTRPARSKRSQKRRPLANGDINSNNKSSLDAAGSDQFTEAEQLLMRLKALWLVRIKALWLVRITASWLVRIKALWLVRIKALWLVRIKALWLVKLQATWLVRNKYFWLAMELSNTWVTWKCKCNVHGC